MKLLVDLRGKELEDEFEGESCEEVEEELLWVINAKFLTPDQKMADKFAKSLESLGFYVKTSYLIREY